MSGRCGICSKNAHSIAQFTRFILKRSPFSNSGRREIIARYSGFAAAVTARAVSLSILSTSVICLQNDFLYIAHIAAGIPAYFIALFLSVQVRQV